MAQRTGLIRTLIARCTCARQRPAGDSNTYTLVVATAVALTLGTGGYQRELDGGSTAAIDGMVAPTDAQGRFPGGRVQETQAMELAAAAPYDETDVSIDVGDVQLAGTLTVPYGTGPFPAAILISGSGPQDRDETVAGMKPFALLADGLARQGIAVLRLDDRGVGGSGGEVMQAEFTDSADDTEHAMVFLRQKTFVDPAQIGLIGHSEGAIVATLVAARPARPSFVVLLAGPAIPIEQLMHEQAEVILAAGGMSAGQMAEQRRIREASFSAVRTGEGWPEVRRMIEQQIRQAIDALPEPQRASIADIDAFVAAQAEQQLAAAQTPWFRELLDFDPSEALSRMRTPLLALYGENDFQVPSSSNATALEQLLQDGKHPDYSVQVIPNANHLFQDSADGSPALYASLDKEFVPSLVPSISRWILARAR